MHASFTAHSPLPVTPDRDSIQQIRQRFEQLNSSRLHLAKSHLTPRQQQALDSLPLLFHYNHPRLPGYLSKASPAGFNGFIPSEDQVQLLKQLARGFRSQANPGRKMTLLALYVMGSVGTVAQSSKSDMDFWLCHSADITDEALILLQKKCEAISLWAKSLGLEWHFFLMQPEAFNRGQDSRLSSESSGSVQHFLLLDEFYRSAILLVGRFPLWWFIGDIKRPAYEKSKYEITHKGFLRENEWLDFGPVGDVPAAEFVSAAIWQLYKSISSPYKSLLKLLVLEVYLSRYPQVLTLSDKMKLLVYTGSCSAATLDPYLLLLQDLTEYFTQRKEFERLELMRQCFYFKVEHSHAQLVQAEAKQQANHTLPLLEALRTWEWQDYDFDHLDRAENWNAQQVLAERKRLVTELTESYRLLLKLARATKESLELNNDEISILGRKLHAAFEHSDGKIEFINPGISKNLHAHFLLFECTDEHWQLFLTNSRWEKSRTPLTSNSSITELVAWCFYNGIHGPNTRIKIIGSEHYKESDMRRWLSILERVHQPDLLQPEHSAFTEPAQPKLVLLLLNDPGQQLVTALEVPNYTLLIVNSWGEVRMIRFDAQLQTLLQWFRQPLTESCQCLVQPLEPQPQRQQVQIFQQLIETLRRHLSAGHSDRLLISIDIGWILVQRQTQWQLLVITRNAELWRQLSAPLSSHQGLHLVTLGERQPFAAELTVISAYSGQHAIQLFYRVAKGIADIFLSDERGSLLRFQQKFHSADVLLKPLHHFIRACLQRNPLLDNRSMFAIFPVAFFELYERRGQLLAERRLVTSDLGRLQLFNLQFSVQHLDLNIDPAQWQLDVWLNGEPVVSTGEQPLLSLVAQRLLEHRRSGQRYPCYITDLDLSLCHAQLEHKGQLQTSHYFRVKIRLEQALFKALLAL